jgi:hypothetical protein
MRRASRSILLAFVAALLAACSGVEIQNAAQASFKSWCRNAPQTCTLHDEKP